MACLVARGHKLPAGLLDPRLGAPHLQQSSGRGCRDKGDARASKPDQWLLGQRGHLPAVPHPREGHLPSESVMADLRILCRMNQGARGAIRYWGWGFLGGGAQQTLVQLVEFSDLEEDDDITVLLLHLPVLLLRFCSDEGKHRQRDGCGLGRTYGGGGSRRERVGNAREPERLLNTFAGTRSVLES